ncbi:acyltransferase [Nocardioides flavus (ex Wang et al. 2016)]|uniref:Acyltransferase n=1 Tax=Nocardioides flavus (ex Wang et al. 2016) TaxID=2058780 RepID=A0ABQ3HMW3_9ACTN|nr:acyltransferase [Nocardioides flavus (ex Wang et al. 2016)]
MIGAVRDRDDARVERDRRPGHHRPDIQALRALAVTLVVVYHFWPDMLPGGFIGVDVFFVISGFLITGALLRRPPTAIGDLGAFWSRRILRLIPAATLTIVVTLVVIWVFRPTPEWPPAARHGLTSMFYVENWRLISDATDYLRAHSAASPFQHFWSLSIEEQFYVLWPLLVALGALLDRRLRRNGLAVVMLLGAVSVASLLSSFALSWERPAEAYFATPARMWQLGAGGLLAWLVLHRPVRLSASLRGGSAIVGLAVVVASAFLIDGDTVYPGWAALLPTVAAAILIHADDPDGRLALRRLTHARPVQFVGDCSYAIYLWHWPIVVLAPGVLGVERGLLLSLTLIALTLALAWLSTTYVENVLRPRSGAERIGRRAVVVLITCSAVVVALCWAILRSATAAVDAAEDRVEQLLPTALEPTCVGAGALDASLSCDQPDELVTAPEFTRSDLPLSVIVGQCINWPPFGELISCSVGDTTAPVKKVALFGNSHAGHWEPALAAIAEEHQWQVDTYTIGACQPVRDDVAEPVTASPDPAACNRIVGEAMDRITAGYDLVVMSTLDRDSGSSEIYRPTLRRFADEGIPVLVIRDTPAPFDPDYDTVSCVSERLADTSACDGAPEDWIGADPLTEEAQSLGSDLVATVDLNDRICREDVCPAVIGGVIVYADFNHLSATFSRTLAPYLEPAVLRAMATTGADG